jgi:isopentenyl-diphosphate delta-isomerase
VAAEFSGWGIPTTEAIRYAREAAPTGFVIASGGIRNGMDAAKAIALGANLAGIAGPFLRAASQGVEPAREFAREVCEVLRITMFSLGIPTVAELQGTARLARASTPR